MKFKNGFSLIEMMIVAGFVGGIALVVMQINKSSVGSQNETIASADYSELRREIYMILSDSDACKASFSGTTFNGASIKTTPKTGLELWTVNQAGARSRKIFSENSKYGKLQIGTISFTMPDYTAGTNWPAGNDQMFKAELKITGDKLVSSKTRAFQDVTVPITISFDTDGSGLSTIKNCSAEGSTSSLVGIQACPTGMNMVGVPGMRASYCIDHKPRAAATYPNAITACYNINDTANGNGRAHLCNYNEWITACHHDLSAEMKSQWEWVMMASFGNKPGIAPADYTNNVTAVGGSPDNTCFSNSIDSATFGAITHQFRCCL